MLQDYVPILIHIIIAVGFATVALLANIMLGRAGKRNPTKDVAYECGVIPEAGPQPRFSVKFYLVAMLFILFDIEVVFMYPWAVVFRQFVETFQDPWSILLSMFSFVVLLLFGYAYAVKKGALDWKS